MGTISCGYGARSARHVAWNGRPSRNVPTAAVGNLANYMVVNRNSEGFLDRVQRAAEVITAVQFEDMRDFRLRACLYRTRVVKMMTCNALQGGKGGYAVVIAEDRQAGVIAGVVDVRFRRGDPDIQEILDTGGSGYFEIANLAVLPDYRRQGHGKTLLRRAEECAREAALTRRSGSGPSYAIVALYVYRDNAAAIAMYEKEGYELVEDFEDAEWIEDIDKGRPPSRPRKVMYRKRMSLVLS